MKKSKLEASCSSPLATVEEIQKRLLRPQDSQTLSSFNSSHINQHQKSCKAKSKSFYETQKIREAESKRELRSRRLEDYLDPELLCAVRVKIGGQKRSVCGEARFAPRNSSEFDEFDRKLGNFNDTKRARIEKNEVADLKSDSDSIADGEFLCCDFSCSSRDGR